MSKELIKKGIKFVFDADYRFIIKSGLGTYDSMEDKEHLKRLFKVRLGYELNLDNPQTFNEKLQWLKLYDRKPIYTTMVDKLAAKKYVSDIIGEEYIIPTLKVWERPEDIDWDALPNQFVLKVTHDSGGLVICKDKNKLDKKAALRKIKKSLQKNYYKQNREWPYKDVPRKIICEKFMEEENGKDLSDYKLFCFDGKPEYCQVISNRFVDERMDFFDMEWNHQVFTKLSKKGIPLANSEYPINKPKEFELMKKFAETLSKGHPFLRVDFYDVNGKIYFGELTFFPASGFVDFAPSEWNDILGEKIKLPID
jgi:hypothetical protein